jgi:hypothetical protein
MNDSAQKDVSKPYEFKSDDIFVHPFYYLFFANLPIKEFGIDIVGDNKTIIHCKNIAHITAHAKQHQHLKLVEVDILN